MKKFSEIKKGDNVYYIDEKNDYQIKPINVKKIENFYNGNRYDLECDVSFYPNQNWSRHGLFCTEEKAAKDFVDKVIKKKKIFATLKPGEKVYAINKQCDSFVCVLTVANIEDKSILFKEGAKFFLNSHQMYSTYFFENLWNIKTEKWGECVHAEGLFINKDDVKSYFSKLKDRKKKKSIEKYVSDTANYGKPISLLDNKGKQLHYGDKIAYVRRNGIHAHTDISFGIVMGESKTKIKILDEEEQKKGKKSPFSYHNELIGSNGLHALEPQNVAFIASGDKKFMEFKK